MGKIALAITILALVVVGLFAGGCASTSQPRSSSSAEAPTQAWNAWELGPLLDAEGNHRSLSLDSPLMAELTAADGRMAEQPAWYDGRRDRQATVHAGYRTAAYETTRSSTRDRFDSNDGDVRDSYRRNTFRDTFIEVVR